MKSSATFTKTLNYWRQSKMNYKFVGDENDISLLTALDYKDNVWGTNKGISIDYDENGKAIIDVIKTFGRKHIAVALSNYDKSVEVYEYKGKANNHRFIRQLDDDEAWLYIQDLFDEDLIRKVGK